MADDKRMKRGVQQALFKYLPGCWVDYTQSGGGVTYAVKVENWNSIQLTGINNKRLLRVVNQRVDEFIENSGAGRDAVVDFATTISEDTYDVLTPKISDKIAAIHTIVKPWVFVCSSCGRVRQFRSNEEFKRREHEKCDKCGKHMTQLRFIRFCKCGYADGIFVPKCTTNPEHGTKYMVRRGSGIDFVCAKCGKKANLPFYCPECHSKLDIKPALSSEHYIPFSLSLIDLLDKRKDVFLDNEENGQGEKVVLGQYLGLIPQEEYEKVIVNGKITQQDEYEEQLNKEAEELRKAGLDEAMIAIVIDAKRRANPNNKILEAIEKVGKGLAIKSVEDLTPLAEQVLEYDELVNARVVVSVAQAEKDAELINDGIRPNYQEAVNSMGFSRVQLCTGVPIVTASYGYTRKERSGDGVKLHGFPSEMEKRNVYASRLETEGVLFEIDRNKIIDWLLENRVIENADVPRDRDEYSMKMWFLDNIHPDLIKTFTAIDDTEKSGKITKAVYTLVHSISHALINEAAELCGLDKSSLSEYILPNIPAVFIYCSNSQGYSMGALYSAFQGQLERWLKHARANSQKCIFDPVCINHEKACAGCLFLNEVSCQHFNKDLDRSYLCGHYNSIIKLKTKGYWEK